MSNWFTQSAASFLALTLCGCAATSKQAYPGDPRPYSELATIYVEGFSGITGSVSFKLQAVDDQSVDEGAGVAWIVDVLPGEHELKLWTNRVVGVFGGYIHARQGTSIYTVNVAAGDVVAVCANRSGLYLKKAADDTSGELRRNGAIARPICDPVK